MNDPSQLKSTIMFKTLASLEKNQLMYQILLMHKISTAPSMEQIRQFEYEFQDVFDAIYEYLLNSIVDKNEFKPIIPLFNRSSQPIFNLYHRTDNILQKHFMRPANLMLASSRSEETINLITQKPLPAEPSTSEVIYEDPSTLSLTKSDSSSFQTVIVNPLKAIFQSKGKTRISM